MFLCMVGQVFTQVVIFQLLPVKVVWYWIVSNKTLEEWIGITQAQWFSLFEKNNAVLKWDYTS